MSLNANKLGSLRNSSMQRVGSINVAPLPETTVPSLVASDREDSNTHPFNKSSCMATGRKRWRILMLIHQEVFTMTERLRFAGNSGCNFAHQCEQIQGALI